MRLDAVYVVLLTSTTATTTASAPTPPSHARAAARKGTMSEKSGAAAPFERVAYTIQGGFGMGGGDLRESETALIVDLATGVAMLTEHQSNAEEGGEAIGTFRTVLSAELVSPVQTELARAHLNEVVQGPQDGPGRSTVRIETRRQGRDHKLEISTGDMTNLAKLDPLWEVLDKAMLAAGKHPYQAIRLELQATPGDHGDLAFTVTVKNAGIEPVAIPDLATLRRESADDSDEHGIGVRVARNPPARPGYTEPPLAWSRVEVVGAEEGTGKPITLPPGGQQAFRTAPWPVKQGSGTLLAQAFFSFYRRPAPVKDRHPYLIRGRVLSKPIELDR